MIRQLLALIFLFTLTAAALARDGGYKVEPIGALAASNVSEAVRGALDTQGWRVMDEKGKTLAELWFRKEVPTAKTDVSGASFGQIPEGTLIGVVNFPSAVSDYRGQGIKPGYYTMRYALILVDGNHLGVSATRDFVLLGPVGQDQDPQAQPKPEDVIKLSRTVSGTNHPSPWYLTQPAGGASLPRVIKDEQDHVILEIKLNTKSGALPIGITLVGKTEG